MPGPLRLNQTITSESLDDLADLRRVGLLRQLVEDAADRVAHVVGGAFDVALQGELDVDVASVPFSLLDWIVSTPSMPDTASSSTLVTRVSTTAAEAPV